MSVATVTQPTWYAKAEYKFERIASLATIHGERFIVPKKIPVEAVHTKKGWKYNFGIAAYMFEI